MAKYRVVPCLLASLLCLGASLHAQTEVELVVLAHKDPLYAEKHLAEVLAQPQNVVLWTPKIVIQKDGEARVPIPEETLITLDAYAGSAQNPTHVLNLKGTGEGEKFTLSCDWLISVTSGPTTTTEHRRYAKFPQTAGEWRFSHFGASDDQGRSLFIGYRAKKADRNE